MLNQKQEEIILFLQREKRASTSKIASYVGLPNDYALKYLNDLLEISIVIKEEETNAVYWKIKNDSNTNGD